MVRYMLHLKQLPKFFWAKTIYYVVYLLNKHPTKGVYEMPQKKLGVKGSLT